MTPRSDPPPIHTGHVRAYLMRERRTRGTAQLILALCAEIDRLRAQQRAAEEAGTVERREKAAPTRRARSQTAEQPSRVSQVPPGGAEA